MISSPFRIFKINFVFNETSCRSKIPLLSIVRATCEEARELGLRRLGLFGTRFTMQAGFYQEVFSEEGIALILPNEDEQDYIHSKYMNELVNGIFLSETREHLLAIVERLKRDGAIQGLILGGTELPLILRDDDVKGTGIPFLDTTQIHVKGVVERLLS